MPEAAPVPAFTRLDSCVRVLRMMHAGRTRDRTWLAQAQTREVSSNLTLHLILEANLRETWRRSREDRAVDTAMRVVATMLHPAAQDANVTELQWRVAEDLIGDMMSHESKYIHLTDAVSCELRTLASWMTRVADGRSAYTARVEALQLELVTPEPEHQTESSTKDHRGLHPERQALNSASIAVCATRSNAVSSLRMATVLIDNERYQRAALSYCSTTAQAAEPTSAPAAATLAQLIAHFRPPSDSDSALARSKRSAPTPTSASADEHDAFDPDVLLPPASIELLEKATGPQLNRQVLLPCNAAT